LQLSRLLELAGYGIHLPGGDPEVESVTHHSGWVRPGSLFVAIRGATDGHRYLGAALAAGAVAVVGEGPQLQLPVPYLVVPDARAALADLAAALEGWPSRDLAVAGITGTDGKTTTTWLLQHLLRGPGEPCGLLSTVGYDLGDGELTEFPAHFTTPEAPQIQGVLAELRRRGTRRVAMEVSSHALALQRVRGVRFELAIWTNLSPEHLDFHGTMENYFAAKRSLIERAPFAVLNAEDPWARRLADRPHWSYGLAPAADWYPLQLLDLPEGQALRVRSPLGELETVLPMLGRYNAANALAALAAAAKMGVPLAELARRLRSFPGVPGRLQLLIHNPFRVVVDFAHTPPALGKVLATLRETTSGQLRVVIGSAGGRRDPSKRAPLGETATTWADWAYFTEEDCRDTPVEQILAEMERGALACGKRNFSSVPDRTQAIFTALSEAKAGDTVLLAGKGVEPTLERGGQVLPWNEAGVARSALAELGLG
jgi:UDP-N-acetylmuramoyl-L-alanyl-D-glutamate--2,6-diaminopimelate ligase